MQFHPKNKLNMLAKRARRNLLDLVDARLRDISFFHERFNYKERINNIGYNLLVEETDKLCQQLNEFNLENKEA